MTENCIINARKSFLIDQNRVKDKIVNHMQENETSLFVEIMLKVGRNKIKIGRAEKKTIVFL